MAEQANLRMKVEDWAAIVHEPEGRKTFGAAAEPALIPANQRRRMPGFVLDAALCGLPLLQQRPESDLVYCSCNGDLSITVDLLSDLARGELLSPAKFSISVHNAPPGMMGLLLGRVGNHTAIAAGEDSLAAGLTEAYARLASGEASSVILVLADAQLPEVYREFDDASPSVYLALALTAGSAEDSTGIAIAPGRAGAAALAYALQAGAREIAFRPSIMQKSAA